MNIDAIQHEFHEKVSAKIRLFQEGTERYRVFTPFLFEDGDHLAVVLKKAGESWFLSDEAHTFMHLTYDIDEKDLRKGTRQTIIDNALSTFRIEDRDGELILPIDGGRYGDALYSFIQALLKVSDVTYLTRERARSTFMDDFRSMLGETIPSDRLELDWHNEAHDPKGIYQVDCRINGMPKPLMVHALASDGRARDATIAMLQFERWGMGFQSMAIFEEQESINRKVLARFSDVCDKQFSSLSGNRERIQRYLKEAIQ